MRTALLAVGISFTFTAAACGATPASSTTEPTPSSTETFDPVVEAALPVTPSQDVEVSDFIENQLIKLQPPSPELSARGPADDSVSPLATWMTVRPCDDVNEWLGGRLPSLTSLIDSGYEEVCATDWADKLPGPEDTLPNGNPVEATAHAFYLPTDTDFSTVTMRQLRSLGIAHLSVYYGPYTWEQEERTDTQSPDGGYATVKTDGHTFGLQNRGDGTRVAWIDDEGDAIHNVTANFPLTPIDSLKVVLADDLAD